MKTTHRDNWRVVISINPQYTHVRISVLGFAGLDSDLDGNLSGTPFELTVIPRRLGDFGTVSMSDRLVSTDVDGDYRRRCEQMLAAFLREPHVRSGRVEVDEEHRCSHCDMRWEELTADEAADESTNIDAHSVEGEPVCCDKAIDDFRAERGIPLPDWTGGAA
ncbi:hypothetical protein PUR59_04395 [Streptomyces sp. SP18ES09]|uniref:hypothetical protein n=1 Tax=Streptomyces sp. SP18ES09 TaxID=3002532 RepID=UPI002E765293|nr:hypothetical protein [Streptomyces sp. SP18ES09]MEE1814261.1 hypothetical protein [Streptomyces sp. SP18ES09]